jgi:hypothetical protein
LREPCFCTGKKGETALGLDRENSKRRFGLWGFRLLQGKLFGVEEFGLGGGIGNVGANRLGSLV